MLFGNIKDFYCKSSFQICSSICMFIYVDICSFIDGNIFENVSYLKSFILSTIYVLYLLSRNIMC